MVSTSYARGHEKTAPQSVDCAAGGRPPNSACGGVVEHATRWASPIPAYLSASGGSGGEKPRPPPIPSLTAERRAAKPR